jgi:hypothetical protein
MDDRFGIFAWTLAGAFSFALLGMLFGGLAGWLSWRNGSASGSVVGRKVADALARLLEGELSDGGRAAVVGGADGGLFLGLLGTLIGLAAGYRGQPPAAWLVPAFLWLLALVLGAVFFGLLAYGLVRLSVGALVGFFLGGIGGALLAARTIGAAHIVPGAVAGIVVGTLATLLLSRS